MACDQLQKIGAYLDRELASAEREAFAAHLKTCAECAGEAARLERVSKFVGAAGWPAYAPRVKSWARKSQQRQFERFAQGLIAAALLVIVVSAGWMYRAQGSAASGVGRTPIAEAWEGQLFGLPSEASATADDDPLAHALLSEPPQ